MRGYRKYN